MLKLIRRWSRSSGAPSRSTPEPGVFVAQPGHQLLAEHQELVTSIKALIGVPFPHWERLHLSLLTQYSAFAQRLPASEAHHHAGPGGLLRHGLEVAHNALLLRRGILLPPNASPEDQASQQDLWTYACLTGALLHDLGKPVVDQEISLHGDADPDRTWTPLSGLMPKGTQYSVRFRQGRVHRQHERIAPLLASQLIPQSGLDWLASDPTLLGAWLAAIQGAMEDAGPLGSIIAKADQRSVAENLAGGISSQMPGTRPKPLAERLLTGLRHLLTSGALPLNRRGAAGFTDGDHLWLVSKRTIDALLVHLIEEGQPGIPSRNDRVMDELQQHRILVPNDDRAIWYCAITIGDWTQSLTCLKVDISRIWPDSDQRPDATGVTVQAHATKPTTKVNSDAETDLQSTPDSKTRPLPSNEPSLPMPPLPASIDPSNGGGGVDIADNLVLPLPENFGIGESANEGSTRGVERQVEEDTGVAISPTFTVPTSSSPEEEATQASGDAGKQFQAWLRDGLVKGRLAINTPQARIHVVPEGLVLVSPGIFKDFDPARWSHVQKRFQKLKLHQRTHDNMNIWTCKAAGTRKQALMKVYLISKTEVQKLGLTLPPPNTAVSLIRPP